MNRILQADVILTLTQEQVVDLSVALMYAQHYPLASKVERDDWRVLADFLAKQCAKQGVHL